MQTKYTRSFKIEAVKKYYTGALGSTYTEVSKALGIGRTTLYQWVKSFNSIEGCKGATSGPLEKAPHSWRRQEKFDALLEVSNMTEEEKSIYCRKQGIFSHHLDEWKQEFINKREGSSELSLEIRALKSENKQLKKELRRKNKALAETAAILVLKKKVQEILGEEDL